MALAPSYTEQHTDRTFQSVNLWTHAYNFLNACIIMHAGRIYGISRYTMSAYRTSVETV